MPEKCFQLMGVFQPITRENRKNGKESERDVDHDEHGRRARPENDFRERASSVRLSGAYGPLAEGVFTADNFPPGGQN